MDALEFLSKLKALDVPAISSDVLKNHEDDIADLNASQLAQGISSDGRPTTLLGKSVYSPITIDLKRQKSGLSGVTAYITGYDTGSLYRDLYAQVSGSQIEYGSRSASAKFFEEKASNRIYGLTDDNREELIEQKISPELAAEISKRLA